MRTSELSILYNILNSNKTTIKTNVQIHTDENTSGDSVLSNKDERDSSTKQLEEQNAGTVSTEKNQKDPSKVTTTDTQNNRNDSKYYPESYKVTLNSESNEKDRNFIKNTVSSTYERKNSNPYLNLFEEFNNPDLNDNVDELHLNIDDFIYLRDIGVYPVNKLMILRRFSSPPMTPDLVYSSKGKKIKMGKPISKVIGWVKNDDDIFNISFNEVWKSQNEWLHEIIKGIIQDQFGMDISSIFPMPGWGQSIMFSFMNNLGWTDYNGKNLPIGDPNLLRTGITRETDSTGLASNMNIKLETTYELKYIDGVDPTTVFYKIIDNLLKMGTDDINFLFRGGNNINELLKFASNPNTSTLKSIVTRAINSILTEVKNKISEIKANNTFTNTINKQEEDKNKTLKTLKDEELIKLRANATLNENTDLYEYYDPTTSIKKTITKTQYEEAVKYNNTIKENKKIINLKNSAANSVQKKGLAEKILNMADSFSNGTELLNYIEGFMDSILVSTIARYEWPIKGAVAQSTGMNMTPWHLTIGNPKAPIICMNHIKVDSVEIKLHGEIFYNDLPRYISATISISNNRPLGKQEIYKFFGTTFIRKHASTVKFISKNLSMDSIQKEVEESEEQNKSKPKKQN